jgi:hypothetical protein
MVLAVRSWANIAQLDGVHVGDTVAVVVGLDRIAQLHPEWFV